WWFLAPVSTPPILLNQDSSKVKFGHRTVSTRHSKRICCENLMMERFFSPLLSCLPLRRSRWNKNSGRQSVATVVVRADVDECYRASRLGRAPGPRLAELLPRPTLLPHCIQMRVTRFWLFVLVHEQEGCHAWLKWVTVGLTGLR